MTDAAHILALIAEADDITELSAISMAVASRIAALVHESNGKAAPEPEKNSDDNGETLTLKEAAAVLRKSPKWIYRHKANLNFVRKIGPRSFVCSKAALLRYRDSRPHA